MRKLTVFTVVLFFLTASVELVSGSGHLWVNYYSDDYKKGYVTGAFLHVRARRSNQAVFPKERLFPNNDYNANAHIKQEQIIDFIDEFYSNPITRNFDCDIALDFAILYLWGVKSITEINEEIKRLLQEQIDEKKEYEKESKLTEEQRFIHYKQKLDKNMLNRLPNGTQKVNYKVFIEKIKKEFFLRENEFLLNFIDEKKLTQHFIKAYPILKDRIDLND